MKTTIYVCADATLTYGPLGGAAKIIKQALPVVVVESPAEAEELIHLVGSKTYAPESDPRFKAALAGRSIKPGYGPEHRYRYSLPDFTFDDVSTLSRVSETMTALRDARRADDHAGVRAAFAKATPDTTTLVDGSRRAVRA